MQPIAVLVIVASCVAAGSASLIPDIPIFHKPTPSPSLNLGEAIRALILSYQRIMPCGIPELGIPPMAPFRQDKVDLDVEKDVISLKGKAKNLVITGLDNFIIVDLKTDQNKTVTVDLISKGHRTDFDIVFPNIDVLGEFDVSLFEDLAGFNFSLHPKGFMNLHLVDIRLNGGVIVFKNLVGGIGFKKLDFYIDVGDIVSGVLDTKLSVAVNQFLNNYLREATLLFVEESRERISKAISDYLVPNLDKRTFTTSENQAIDALIQAASYLQSVNCGA